LGQRDEVTRERKRLYKEEFNELYSSSIIFGDQIKKKEIGRACSTYGERKGAGRFLVGKLG
jgi:hypothetical protein